MTRHRHGSAACPTILVAGLFLGLAGIQTARADIIPTSYLRDVMSFATISPLEGSSVFDNDSVQSTEGGTFDETLGIELTSADASAISSVDQTSEITPTGLIASGQFGADAFQGTSADFAEVLGATRIIYKFSIDETVTGRLFGMLGATGQGVANALLMGSSGILVNYSLRETALTLDEHFVLTPGAYELHLTTSGYGQSFNGEQHPSGGCFQLELFVDSPASVDPALAVDHLAPRVLPNPVRDSAEIRFQSPLPGGATLLVTDATGRRIRTLHASGETNVTWDARDDAGRQVPNGMYLVRVSGTNQLARALVLRN